MSICHVGENNGSYTITIPADVVKTMGINKGDKIYVDWRLVKQHSDELELLD